MIYGRIDPLLGDRWLTEDDDDRLDYSPGPSSDDNNVVVVVRSNSIKPGHNRRAALGRYEVRRDYDG